VGGHIEVQDTAPVMGQHQKHVKHLEAKGGHREEVDGDQLLGMILQKGAPGLRRRLAAAHHVFADTARENRSPAKSAQRAYDGQSQNARR